GQTGTVKDRTRNLADIGKIGVYVNLPGLGDMVFITPLFRALKRGFPGAETCFIGRMGRAYVAPLLETSPYIDRLLEYDFYHPRDVRHHLDFIRRARRERFDLLIDTQRKFVPSLILALAGARFRVGYSAAGVFSHFRVESRDRAARHTADVSLDLVRALGIPAELELEVNVPAENIRNAETFFEEHGIAADAKVLGLIPSAGMPDKRWDAVNFAEVARAFHAEGFAVIVFGAEADAAAVSSVRAAAGVPVVHGYVPGGSVLDAAALMRRCAVVVGNDSGPLHLAAAAGAPCVGIYGPTLPTRFGLLGARARNICRFEACAPCGVEKCDHRKCIAAITPEEVIAAAVELLSRDV
ncbi:MAG: glycosyltransferase family 9 protein, partial [bacterium]